MDKTIEKLMTFIRIKTGSQINYKTKMFRDLGMADLDAEMFFLEFANEFHVDLTALDSSQYIDWAPNISGLFKRGKKIKTFNIRHLKEVVDKGKWFDPLE